MHAVCAFPVWREVSDKLANHRSVLVHVPRQYGGREFVEGVLAGDGSGMYQTRARLTLPQLFNDGGVDYPGLWRELKRVFCIKGSVKCDTLEGCVRQLAKFLHRRTGAILLVVTGGSRSHLDAQYRLLAALFQLHAEMRDARRDPFVVLAVDDYSLYYYENWIRERSITFDYVDPVYGGALSEEDIRGFLQRHRKVGPGDSLHAAARLLHRLTGGHGGLVLQAADWIPLPLPGDGGRVEPELAERLRQGSVLANVREALSGNPVGFSREAVAYREPAYAPGSTVLAENLQHLVGWGVLQVSPFGRVALCGGVIREMVEEIAASHPRAGGAAAEELDDLDPEPGDVVIVHLSDLHVGPNFRFFLPDVEAYRGLKSANEFLQEDLETLGILGRVDGLVVSGDFAERGNEFDQFLSAQKVLEQITGALGIPLDRVALIAGNHDINWSPGEFAEKNPVTKVSRQYYEAFCKLLGKSGTGATLTSIPSPDGKRRVRVVGLDSNLVEGPAAGGVGFVGRDALREAAGLLRADAANAPEEVATWVTVHHHVFPATNPSPHEAGAKRVSLFANASEVLDSVQAWGAELVLHGHEHQPSITIAQRWDDRGERKGNPFSRIVSIGAGSFSLRSHLGPIGKNHYYVLHRSKDALTVYSRVMDSHDVAFIGHGRIRIEMAPTAAAPQRRRSPARA